MWFINSFSIFLIFLIKKKQKFLVGEGGGILYCSKWKWILNGIIFEKAFWGGVFCAFIFPLKKTKELLQQVDWVGAKWVILCSSPKKETPTKKWNITKSTKACTLYWVLFSFLIPKIETQKWNIHHNVNWDTINPKKYFKN